jgi:glycosyltransferase involved in cell wall biosynthesis
MTTTVSVIIPTFNRPILVQQAVESVLNQEGDFVFDIIVVDDGSAPDTREALQRFGSAIRYVRQENAGLNPARNHGMRLAKGEYIALLDDDDVWLPSKTALLMKALGEFPQAGFAHSDFFIWKPDGDIRRTSGLQSWFPTPFVWDEIYSKRVAVRLESAQRDLSVYFGDIYYWSLFSPMVLPSTAIIRRAMLVGAEFPAVNSVGDWEFFARFSHRCGAVFLAHETTLNRSHEDAFRLTRVNPCVRMGRRIEMIDRLWRADPAFMGANGSEVDRVEAACLRKLARLGILRGEAPVAREALRALRAIDAHRSPSDPLLWLLARVPFVHHAARLLRFARHRTSTPVRS